MPHASTRSTRRLAKRKRESDDLSDDSSAGSEQGLLEDVDAESIIDNLTGARRGVEKLLAGIHFLRQENDRLRADLVQSQQNAGRVTRANSSQKNQQTEASLRRQVQQLERVVKDLKVARKKDKRIIEKLRTKEVEYDAKELVDDENGDAQGSELGQGAIQLLRRVSDLMDMNTLAEGEECAICMEKMDVDKCYSLRCRHPVCSECFERLGDGTGNPPDCTTALVQCPHCREICPREECEIITHTAVQQWDSLLEISSEWARMDTSEMDVEEEDEGEDDDDDDEDSPIINGAITATQSPQLPRTAEETEEPDTQGQATPPAPASPEDIRQYSYQNLPSPSKRERLQMLVAQRSNKRRM
ncbi:hypothetical protein BDN67DRAFT_1067491 [Paxillus ammoniavirescens]|nr:hypothetical protein BDN67DRAFT_1067491 [Paxillus ammoniavirescens]